MTLLTFPSRENSSPHCAAETRTGVLTLISGIKSAKTAAKTQQQKQQNKLKMISNNIKQDNVRMLLRHKMTSSLPTTRVSNEMELVRQVRVTLFSNVINPYLVVFNSINKYANPITCIRLNTCHVIDDDATTFHINIAASKLLTTAPCGEIDQSQKIIFRASTSQIKQSWVEAIQLHSGAARASSSPCLRRISPSALSSLPTLVEQEDDEIITHVAQQQHSDVITDVTATLESDVTRRNSLNSLVGRLRSFELSHAPRVFAS